MPESLENNNDNANIEGSAVETNINKELQRQIEGLLFIAGEPMALSELIKLLEKTEEEVKKAIDYLKEDYLNNQRGLTLVENENSYQLTTHPDVSEIIAKYIKEILKEDLSPASLETLAIIAYKGPLNRMDIDNIRGVNSSFILRSLLIRGLVDRELDPHRGNAYTYRPSFDLIRKLGLEKLEDLPDYEKYRTL